MSAVGRKVVGAGESDASRGGAGAFVEIQLEELSEAAVSGLVEEFVTRDGTDYGSAELSLEEKVARLTGQLASGEAKIVFDPESKSANVVLTRELQGRSGG